MVIVKEIVRTYYSCSDEVKLDIDLAIEELEKSGTLLDQEVVVLNATKEQYSLIMIGEFLGVSTSAVGRILDCACGKIADHLGPEYQEEKIFKAVEDRLGRGLTNKERSFCWKKLRDFGRNRYSRLNIFNFNES